jgi:hypothetical protein
MGAVHAEGFRRRRAVTLGVGEGVEDQLATVTIDGIMEGYFGRLPNRLGTDDSGGEVM